MHPVFPCAVDMAVSRTQCNLIFPALGHPSRAILLRNTLTAPVTSSALALHVPRPTEGMVSPEDNSSRSRAGVKSMNLSRLPIRTADSETLVFSLHAQDQNGQEQSPTYACWGSQGWVHRRRSPIEIDRAVLID